MTRCGRNEDDYYCHNWHLTSRFSRAVLSYLIIIAQLREDLKTFFSVVGEHSALQNLNTDLKTELAECKFEYRLHHIGETYVVLRVITSVQSYTPCIWWQVFANVLQLHDKSFYRGVHKETRQLSKKTHQNRKCRPGDLRTYKTLGRQQCGPRVATGLKYLFFFYVFERNGSS